MTPNQKARELMDRLYHSSFGDSWKSYLKRCAIVVVDEIIKSGPTMPSEFKDSYWIATESANKFWEEVKEEIQKL